MFILFFSAVYFIQQPKVQTFLVQKTTSWLSTKIGTKVSVGSVDIKFIKTLQLTDIYFEDQQKDTLLYAHSIDVDLMIGETLKEQIIGLKNKKLHFNNLALDGIKFHGYRDQTDTTFNFSYIFEKLKTNSKNKNTKKEKATPFDIKLNTLKITNAHLIFDDKHKDTKHEIIAQKLFIDVEKIDLNTTTIFAKKIDIKGAKYYLTDYNNIPKIDDGKPSKLFMPQNMGVNIKVNDLQIEDGGFGYKVLNKKPKIMGDFNLNEMNYHLSKAQINNYTWNNDGMKLDIEEFVAQEGKSLNVKKLTAKATLDNGKIELQNLDLLNFDTKIKGDYTLQFINNNWNDFSNFESNVIMTADITDINVKGKDVNHFLPKNAQKYLPINAILKGKLKGKLNNLRAEKLLINVNKSTAIDITGNIKGLPNINQTLFDLKINKLQTNATELKQILNYIKLPAQIDKLGNIAFKGTYFGFINDFVAKGLLTTNVGSLDTDVKMTFLKGKQPTYAGKINAHSLDLAALTGNKKLSGKVDIDLNASGKGFDTKNLNSKLKGTIRNLTFNNFTFKNILFDGFFDKKKFDGNAFYDDGCMLIQFDGIADLNEKVPSFNFKTSVKNVDFQELNLMKEKFVISLDGNLKFRGNNLNNIVGNGIFKNIILQNTSNIFVLSDVDIDLQNNGIIKNYTIQSNEIDANFNGIFDPTKIVQTGKVFLSNYTSLIKLKKTDTLKVQHQQLDAHLVLKSDFGLFKFLVPKLKYVSALDADIQFNSKTGLLDIVATADSALYDNISLKEFKLKSNIKNKNLLSNIDIQKIKIGKNIADNIKINATSSKELLLTGLQLDHNNTNNGINIVNSLSFNKDTIIAKFLESNIKMNNKIWSILPGNSITVIDSAFIAHNFSLVQDSQKITIINGRNSLKDLKVNIENIEIKDFTQLIDSTQLVKAGKLSGNINLKNITTNLQANTDITINGLQVLDYRIKYIGLDGVYGKNGKKTIELGGTIEDNDYQLSFDGLYNMEKKGSEFFDVNADIQKVNLKFLEDLLKKELLVNKAFVKGQVNVSGNIKNPILTGRATVIDTADLTFKLLGANFKLANEEINLTNKGFDFGDITLYDNFGNTAFLNGILSHTGFKDWSVDAAIKTTEKGFCLMNTTYKDNQDFYGLVFAKGTAEEGIVTKLDGKFNDLKVVVNAETLKNTTFNLPVSDKAQDKGYSFIKFINPNDTTPQEVYKAKISGIDITLNITATKDAKVNLILNPATDDKISAFGDGDLVLKSNNLGMDLGGIYYIDNGLYDFKLDDLVLPIRKKFNIKKGSAIKFSGNPLNAILDIEAIYQVKASLKNLVTDSSSVLMNQTVPIDLSLLIGGTLSKSTIDFKLSPSANGLSSQSEEIKTLLDGISNNKTDLNNQAMMLLIFNSFLPANNNTSFATDALKQIGGNTVTDLISAQLSSFITSGLSKLIKGASLDVGISGLAEDQKQFNINYRQELGTNRVILNIGGNVNVGGSTSNNSVLNQQSNTGIAGDFSLEYLITEDGKIRLKTFAKTANYDIINKDRIKTGGAISFQKDFDSLDELFQMKKRKKKNKQQSKPPIDAILIEEKK